MFTPIAGTMLASWLKWKVIITKPVVLSSEARNKLFLDICVAQRSRNQRSMDRPTLPCLNFRPTTLPTYEEPTLDDPCYGDVIQPLKNYVAASV